MSINTSSVGGKVTFFVGARLLFGEVTSELVNEGLSNEAGVIGDAKGRGDTMGAMFA